MPQQWSDGAWSIRSFPTAATWLPRLSSWRPRSRTTRPIRSLSAEGLRLGWEGVGPELATELVEKGIYGRLDGAENMKEGLKSFVEKRKPIWHNSKL